MEPPDDTVKLSDLLLLTTNDSISGNSGSSSGATNGMTMEMDGDSAENSNKNVNVGTGTGAEAGTRSVESNINDTDAPGNNNAYDENDEDIFSVCPLPTRDNLRKGLQWLVQGATEGDILFFHFSGHGGQTADTSGFESDGLNETIMPLDFSVHGHITDDEIWDTLVYPLPAGVKLIAVMDCCHSGTGLDLPYDYMIKKGEWKEDVNPAHSKGDVVQFSGCRDSQYSADSKDKYKYGGAMTTAFVQALKTNPFATYAQLLELIYKNLKERKFKQRPQLTSSQRFDVNRKAFSFIEGIEPNQNSRIGRTMRKQVKKKKIDFLLNKFRH